MAILDTFISVFSADTDALKKGYDQSKQSTDDIVKSMKEAEGQSKKTSDGLISFAKKAAGFLAVTALAKSAIGGAMDKAADVHLFNQTANSIGVAVDEMDAFERSMQDSGATGEAAVGSLTSVFKAVGEAANDMGSTQGKVFSDMGISINDANGKIKSSVTLMKDLAGAAESLDPAQAEAYFQKLGITDRRVIETLLQGKKGLEDTMRAHKELGGVTKESAAQAAKFDTAMNKLGHAQDRVGLGLMDALLPAITWTIDKLGDLIGWLNKNKAFVVGFFAAIAAVVTAVYLPAMLSAAAATLTALAPFILIGAAIAAVAVAIGLLVDDIYNFIQGNDSFIGQILEKYPLIASIFDGIGFAMFKLVEAFQAGLAGVQGWANDFVSIFEWLRDLVMGIFDGLIAGIKSALSFVTGAVDKASGAVKKLGSWLGFGGDAEDANNQLDAAASEPLNSTTSNAISNQTSQRSEQNIGIGEIKIQTNATDAAGMARETRSELQEQLANLSSETQSGVDR